MGIRSFIKRSVKAAVSNGPTPAPAPKPAAERAPLPPEKDAQGYQAVLHVGELAQGHGRTVVVDGHGIALFHVNGSYYAIDDACTHEDAPLGEGEMEGPIVLCPYHDWRYDVTTGECLTDKTRPAGCFSTKVASGMVWVGRRTSEGTTDRGGEHDDGLQVTNPLD